MTAAPTIAAVLFDLDGTLLDTAPDLAHATNQLRAEHGLPALPFAAIRPWVSHGGTALTRLALGIPPGSSQFEAARERLLALYFADLALHTRPFPGMAEVLEALEAAGLPWGVVTNKPAWLTDPLLRAIKLTHRAACVISGDTTPERKPHPAPMLRAAAEVGVAPAQCLYLGDAERDIEAAHAAGMPGLIAAWGYIADTDQPEAWRAEGSLQHPGELLDWLGLAARAVADEAGG